MQRRRLLGSLYNVQYTYYYVSITERVQEDSVMTARGREISSSRCGGKRFSSFLLLLLLLYTVFFR